MAADQTIPAPAATDLPTWTILLDGSEMAEEYQLLQISTVKAVNKISYGKIILSDGDPAAEDFLVSSAGDFLPGTEVEIQLGYHSENTTVFKGVITKHGIRSRKNMQSVLIVEMRDAAMQMTVGEKSGYYYESSDSDIIEEIIGEYSDLTPSVEATDVTHARMVKYRCSDWDFINYRADANGKLVVVSDGEVIVKAPEAGEEPALSLNYGTTMLEFEAELESRTQFAGVKAASWDFASQEVTESEAASPSPPDQGSLTSDDLSGIAGLDAFEMKHTGHVNDEELQAWADSRLLRSHYAKVRGRTMCQGFAEIIPGNILELSGVGEIFNGKSLVTAVRQQFSTTNWTTDIQFGMDPEPYGQKQKKAHHGASGLLPPVEGLQIGVVNAIEEDPDGEDRVQVKLPVIDADEEGTWARVSSLDAGENRGAFFRPEVGDEVVLGFLNDDPRDPVILGMLNSSAKPAPIVGSDDNHEKGFVTRSEMKLLFNDETSVMTLETPNGNTLVLSDDEGSVTIADENDNSVVLDADGILMTDANGNTVTMSSDGIALDSGADVSIVATGDVNIEGVNVNCVASAEFVGEGSAGAKLSSGALATIEGGIVQIN